MNCHFLSLHFILTIWHIQRQRMFEQSLVPDIWICESGLCLAGKTWAPKDVERAIYSVAINEQGKIKGPKRKRED